MEKKQKKAQMHVEMVVSFVIFVGFLLFLLYFLNPVGKENLSFSSLDKVQELVLSNISISYRTVTLVLASEPTSDDCFKFDANDFLDENLVAYASGTQTPVDFKSQGNEKKIELQLKSGQKVYKIYSFKEFSVSNPSGCSANSPPPSSWGLIENTGAVFEKYLNDLKDNYVADYSKLKTDLGLQKDFDFVVYDESRTELFNARSNFEGVRGNEILSRDIPLTMIDKDGKKTKIILNLRVW